MKFLKATVLERPQSVDRVYLETDLPNPIWPFTGHASMSMEVVKGKGLEFVEEHFPEIEVEVIKAP